VESRLVTWHKSNNTRDKNSSSNTRDKNSNDRMKVSSSERAVYYAKGVTNRAATSRATTTMRDGGAGKCMGSNDDASLVKKRLQPCEEGNEVFPCATTTVLDKGNSSPMHKALLCYRQQQPCVIQVASTENTGGEAKSCARATTDWATGTGVPTAKQVHEHNRARW
jgi:hypothetical protein